MKAFCFILFSFLTVGAYGQYAPQAGLPGSTAINASSTSIVGWAAGCTVSRGYMDIADQSLGLAAAGDSTLAIGYADGSVVSLGDSGVAILTFDHPIYNGEGPDFAVFENGFRDPADSAHAFLELAFVEISSDGVNYFRFPATSLTSENVQIGNGDYLAATSINNLAGKYVSMNGTPFDLGELTGISGLDVNNVTHVRIVDVIGAISGHPSRDSAGRVINDPYPTPFPSGGFDLDAVGLINEVGVTEVKALPGGVSVSVFPNPATDRIMISVAGGIPAGLSATVKTISGSVVAVYSITEKSTVLPVAQYPAGMYYIVLQDAKGNKWVEKVARR